MLRILALLSSVLLWQYAAAGNKLSVQLEAVRSMVPVGSNAMFMVSILNDGSTVLDHIRVSCDVLGAASCVKFTETELAPGDKYSYMCAISSIDKTTINAVTACGKLMHDPDAPEVCSTRSQASVTVTTQPGIMIGMKVMNSVCDGGMAAFTIAVNNVGTQPLTNIRVVDPRVPDCERNLTKSLGPNTGTSFTCYSQGVKADFKNAVSVFATCNGGVHAIQDSTTADVVVSGAAIRVAQTLASPVCEDDTAWLTTTVTNVGCEPLQSIAVKDDAVRNCSRSLTGVLYSGGTQVYMCSAPNVQHSFDNQASVTAQTVGKGSKGKGAVQVRHSAEVTIAAIRSPLELTMEVEGWDYVEVGDRVKFRIEVTNRSKNPCRNVMLENVVSPNCQRSFDVIKAGKRESYTCLHASTMAASFASTVTVTADCGVVQSGCGARAQAQAVVKLDGDEESDNDSDGEDNNSISSAADDDGAVSVDGKHKNVQVYHGAEVRITVADTDSSSSSSSRSPRDYKKRAF